MVEVGCLGKGSKLWTDMGKREGSREREGRFIVSRASN